MINQCKGFAINLNHKKIEDEDIEKGLNAYSVDLLTDVSFEIRDILPEAEDVLYKFIASPPEISAIVLFETIHSVEQLEVLSNKIIDLLLWYGFLGIKTGSNEIKYIYHVHYNMQLLKGLVSRHKENVVYVINPGFWPALLSMRRGEYGFGGKVTRRVFIAMGDNLTAKNCASWHNYRNKLKTDITLRRSSPSSS